MRETRVGRRRAGELQGEGGSLCLHQAQALSVPPPPQPAAGALAEENKTVLGPAVLRQEPGLSGSPEPGEPRGKPREASGAFFWREHEWKRREPERARVNRTRRRHEDLLAA